MRQKFSTRHGDVQHLFNSATRSRTIVHAIRCIQFERKLNLHDFTRMAFDYHFGKEKILATTREPKAGRLIFQP